MQGKELQKEVVLLFNMFNNRFNDLVNSSDKEDVISCRQTKNATSPLLLGIRRNRIAGHSEIEKGMEGANEDIFEVCFLYQRIIKCNW